MIRKATIKDLFNATLIERECTLRPRDQSQDDFDLMAQFLADPNTLTIVSVNGKKFNGILQCYIFDYLGNFKSCIVKCWYVQERFRNKGIGKQLLMSAKEYAKMNGCKHIEVLADDKTQIRGAKVIKTNWLMEV